MKGITTVAALPSGAGCAAALRAEEVPEPQLRVLSMGIRNSIWEFPNSGYFNLEHFQNVPFQIKVWDMENYYGR